MSNIKKYVIVGNGVAGMTAAEEIRKIDKDSEIKLLCEEEYLTYYRVKLSHFISKDFQPQDLLVHNQDWYKSKNIDVALGAKVKSIRVADSLVVLENGDTIPYDKLLLSNGGSPFIPPVMGSHKEGVLALRTLNDLVKIQSYLRNCNEVTVVGGGLLGLEAAWALRERGLKVHVVEYFSYLLPRQLDEDLAGYVKDRLEKMGLTIHLSAASHEILGEHKVHSLELKDGRMVHSDMILFSTGVKPNLDIVQETGLTVNKGIVVDHKMKTSIDNIYAAGDVAEYNGVVMGLWSTASEQGKIAGKNMTGNQEVYSPSQPATLLSIGDLSLFSAGEIKSNYETLCHREGQVFYKLFIEGGKLIGAVLIGDIKKMGGVKKAVTERKDLSDLISKGLSPLEIINNL